MNSFNCYIHFIIVSSGWIVGGGFGSLCNSSKPFLSGI